MLKNMKNTEMPHLFEHIHNEQSPNLQGLCSYGVYITSQSWFSGDQQLS